MSTLQVEKGTGTALGDIENVNYQIGRKKAEELKDLHRLLFGVQGKVCGAGGSRTAIPVVDSFQRSFWLAQSTSYLGLG